MSEEERQMAETSGVQAVAGLKGLTVDAGGFTASGEHVARLDLPQSFTSEHMDIIQKDIEILAEIVNQYPDDFLALQNAIVQHDRATARQLADKLGLNEQAIVARGGGVWGLVIVIAVAAAILLEHD
jgi:hypothetical protein